MKLKGKPKVKRDKNIFGGSRLSFIERYNNNVNFYSFIKRNNVDMSNVKQL